MDIFFATNTMTSEKRANAPVPELPVQSALSNFKSDEINMTTKNERDSSSSLASLSMIRNSQLNKPPEGDLEKQPPPENSADADLQRDPFEVRWDGDDQENIQLRSLTIRWVYAIIVSCCSIVITCSSSIYSMAVNGIREDFGTSHTVTVLGITFFLLGMGWGPVFLAPISEFHGRRIVYIMSLLCMLPFQILTGFAPNIEGLLIGRFLAGFAGSAFMGVASGSFSDMFIKEEIMLPVMMYTLTPFCGPGLGPFVGGMIVANTGNWRWTMHVMSIAVGVMLICMLLIVPETYAPLLLKAKAKRMRKDTGDDRYYAPIERSTKSLFETIFLSCKRPMQMLAFEPMLTLLCIYSGLLLSLLYLFFVSYPYVFETVYHFDTTAVSLAFIGLVVGPLLAAPTVVYNKHYIAKEVKKGDYQPEMQLPQTMFAAIIIPIGMFIFGWTCYSYVHWMGPIIGGAIIIFGLVIAYNGIFAFTIDAYRVYAASAMACNGVVRSTMASVFPLFGLQLYENLGVHWSTTMLAFLVAGFIPMPFLFYKYGSRIRAKSRFAWS